MTRLFTFRPNKRFTSNFYFQGRLEDAGSLPWQDVVPSVTHMALVGLLKRGTPFFCCYFPFFTRSACCSKHCARDRKVCGLSKRRLFASQIWRNTGTQYPACRNLRFRNFKALLLRVVPFCQLWVFITSSGSIFFFCASLHTDYFGVIGQRALGENPMGRIKKNENGNT